MSSSLSSLNDFISLQTEQSKLPEIDSTLSCDAESIVINSQTRTYQDEIKFNNGKNEFRGSSFIAHTKNGDIDLVESAGNTEGIDKIVGDVSSTLIKYYTTADDEVLKTVNNNITILQSNITTSYKNYVNDEIYKNLSSSDSDINYLSSQIDNNEQKSVKADGILQKNLNAYKLSGLTVDEIISKTAKNVTSNLTVIDCGEI